MVILVTVLAVIGGFALVIGGGYIALALTAAWLYSSAMSGNQRRRRK